MTDTLTYPCNTCGRVFDTDAEEFGHDCERLTRRFRTVPNGFGGTTTIRYATGEQMAAGHSYAGGGTRGRVTMATDRQRNYLASLGFDGDTSSMTKAAASEAIDNLLRNRVAATPAEAPQVARTNRYAGSCGTCHQTVPENTGRLVSTNGRWVVFHAEGACPTPALAPVRDAAPAVEMTDGQVFVTAAGVFVKTVESKAGSFYAKAWDGRGWEYTPGLINDAANWVTPSAEQAAAFGHQHHRCVFCFRNLKDDGANRSVQVGYGPVCATKYGLPWG